MLKLKHLFENYSLAKEALKNWNYDTDNLDEMLSQFRISSNAIYPFCQDGKVCFLRLAPIDEKNESNVVGEMEFIHFLIDRHYPALEPLKAKTGEVFLRINTQWGDYFAAAFSRVSGIPIEKTDFSNDIMFEYGKALGKLHALSAEYVPEHKKWMHTEVLEWMEATLREYEAKDDIMAALSALKEALDELPIRKDHYGLIHYDFEPDNVFFDKESGTCSVIDFDDSMYHWYALDIEQVFESLESEMSGEILETARNMFIKGYRTEHCYTEETKALQPLMHKFIDLYGYTRLIRCVAERFENEPEWLVELRIKLGQYIVEKEINILNI